MPYRPPKQTVNNYRLALLSSVIFPDVPVEKSILTFSVHYHFTTSQPVKFTQFDAETYIIYREGQKFFSANVKKVLDTYSVVMLLC